MKKTSKTNNEITHHVDLCVGGKLNPTALGWSRRPLIRPNVSGHFLRKKKWNYWAVMNDVCFFSVTISNIDYLGLTSVFFLNLESKAFFEEKVITPFGIGCDLPETIYESVSFRSRRLILELQSDQESVSMNVSIENTNLGRVDAQLKVYWSSYESLTVVVPWSWRKFQLTTKCVGLPVEGTVIVGNRIYEFDVSRSFATLDFGRGVWKYRTFWNWASFATIVNKNVVGINLGAGWTNGTGTNENAIFVNGRVFKIKSDVAFDYDVEDLFKPWHIYTKSSDEIELEFYPIFERRAKNNLILVSSEIHQMIGKFKGFVRGENGSLYIVEDALGWSEEHRARW